jgi:excisionase family DNA binding protein
MTLTVPEAARRVGRDPSTVRRWIRQGRLKATRVGSRQVVDEEALVAVLGNEQAALPVPWQTMTDGRPMPNIVAALRRTRGD